MFDCVDKSNAIVVFVLSKIPFFWLPSFGYLSFRSNIKGITMVYNTIPNWISVQKKIKTFLR